MARFCQMILNDGELDGKRYVSAAAVKEMTRKQTPEAIKEGYGLGWAAGGGSFGHGGAYATHMDIDPQRQLVMIFMVHHAGFPGADGGKIYPAFTQAAVKAFGLPVGPAK
jgi:CubicO group peptidase (beta-lactamase class C family)